MTPLRRRDGSRPPAIFREDLLDAALVLLTAPEPAQKTPRELVRIFGAATSRRDRIGEFAAVLNEALAGGIYVRKTGRAVTLTPAAKERLRRVRLLGGMPPAIALARYAHERRADDDWALTPCDQMLMGALGSYDDALTVAEIASEWERRHGGAPYGAWLVSRLDALRRRGLVRECWGPAGATARAYYPTARGFEVLSNAVAALVPRGLTARGTADPWIEPVAGEEVDAFPPLANPHLPVRVRDALANAIDAVRTTLTCAASDLETGRDAAVVEDLVFDEILPREGAAEHDARSLHRLAATTGAFGCRLATEAHAAAHSASERIVARAIVREAERIVRVAVRAGQPALSARERFELSFLADTVFGHPTDH